MGFRARPPAAQSLPLFTRDGTPEPIVIRRIANARTMRLVIDPRDGQVRLTLPPRAGLRAAVAWVESKRDWIEAELARVPIARPFAPDARFPLGGSEATIDWAATHPRTPRLDGDRLIVGGPLDALNMRVVRWLRARALSLLDAETRAYADDAAVVVGAVTIGDARGRWGSCAASGDIRYSWRLILAPAAVRRATVAHEVAHRLHMDHSPAFHAAAARLFGRDPVAERAWLRAHGASLHWWGRA
ncbi:M48 family metallopeptidase [Sphingomonas sp. 1P06PA]|uniref:M48 family metallopeptidase n=1 Tax=Sphingomonas sp. 1P06PA TaxID=554121 RepID=UPI0039A6C4A2